MFPLCVLSSIGYSKRIAKFDCGCPTVASKWVARYPELKAPSRPQGAKRKAKKRSPAREQCAGGRRTKRAEE